MNRTQNLDEIEQAIERRIGQAIASGDNDWAQELAVALAEYRKFYKVGVAP